MGNVRESTAFLIGSFNVNVTASAPLAVADVMLSNSFLYLDELFAILNE